MAPRTRWVVVALTAVWPVAIALAGLSLRPDLPRQPNLLFGLTGGAGLLCAAGLWWSGSLAERLESTRARRAVKIVTTSLALLVLTQTALVALVLSLVVGEPTAPAASSGLPRFEEPTLRRFEPDYGASDFTSTKPASAR